MTNPGYSEALALATGLSALTGIQAQVSTASDTPQVYWSPDDQVKMQNYISSIVNSNSNKPNDFDIDFMPVVAPIVFEKVFPWAVGVFALGWFIGNISNKRK